MNLFWLCKKRAAALTLLLSLLLHACVSEPEYLQELDLYTVRLSRVLEIKPEPINKLESIATPSLTLPIESASISVLDFLKLYGCELQLVLGESNSLLGQVAGHSQSLIQTLAFLQTAPVCIDSLKERGLGKLATELQAAHALKRRELPKLIFNAIMAGPEYQVFWSGSVPQDYPANTSSAVIESINWLTETVKRWRNGDYSLGVDQLERHLAILRTGDGGALLRSLRVSAQKLAMTRDVMEQKAQAGNLCLSKVPTQRYRNFEQVVRLFFVQGIQPRQAALHRRYYDLIGALHLLEATIEDVFPPSYMDWQRHRDEAFLGALLLPAENVKKIKALASHCGSSLGS